MSTHDDGYGRKAGPNPGSQSDFTNRPSLGQAPGAQTWGNNALNARQSEVTLMAHGAGRPGQPAGGQRPIFGGGSPVFAQMPTYTPVTRGPEPRPQAPQPPQQAYTPYDPSQHAAPPQPRQQAASGLSYPSPQSPAPLSYPSPHPTAAPSYQSPQPGAAPSYQGSYQPQAPSPSQASSYQATEFASQSYQPTNQPIRPQSLGAEHPGSQPYPASSYGGAQGFPNQPYRDQNFGDASFPAPGAGDASFPESSFDQNFADPNFSNQNFAKQNFGDASFPEQQGFDASFPEQGFDAAHDFGQHDQLASNQYGQQDGQPRGFDNFTEETSHDYGQVPASDPRRQLQAFDAIYDQPPQISLGSNDQTRRAQDFYEGERIDADFLDEGQAVPTPGARAKGGMTIRGRSAFMVGSALLGAIALGGALAFAYKQSGGGLSGEQPPLVQADARPVKEAPEQAGGKDFPQKNKLIYDRLQNGDEPETERLVPRQENVAVPALPPSPDGGPASVATTDFTTPTTQAVGGAEPIAVASVDDGSMPDGGPRKVKTMVVKPDGSVMAPPVAAAEAPAAIDQTAAAPAAEAAPQAVASLQAPPPAPEAKPKPVQKPAVQQTASVAPQAAPTKYVVQVGSKKNQTEALASFADMQQKYPSLLASYRPMVQKADLGAKGIWYRLRIGPIADKTAASKLCTQLKSQGLPDCLVMAQ